MNVLFVCEGNICRSPMAEALLKETLGLSRVDGVQVSSCGLRARPGTRAEPRLSRVIGNAYRHLKGFGSRQISAEIVNRADLILTMENSQVNEILALFPQSRAKISTVTGFAGEEGDVRDYLGDEHGDFLEWLKECHSTLNRCVATVADKVSTLEPSRLEHDFQVAKRFID